MRVPASAIRTLTRSFSSRSREQQFLVINSVGLDRPGIVSEITKRVVDANGNIGASQAAKLGSHFGLMMLVSIPKEQSDTLQRSLANFKDMSTVCYVTNDPKAVSIQPRDGYSGHFRLSGADHPGIVYEVTAFLAKHRLNIEQLETSEEDAPFGGSTLFHMEGIATSPAPLAHGFSIDEIREELRDLANRLNCDIELLDLYDEKDNASFYAG